jgi:hypothetical protein
MKGIVALLLLSISVFAASVTTKAVGCEIQENVERAYFLWENNGSKGFIKFMTRNQCELIHEGAKVEVISEESAYYKVVPLNLRELWVRKGVVAK